MSGPGTPQAGGQAPPDPQSPGGTHQAQPPQAGSGQQAPSTSQFKSVEEAEAAYQRLLKDKQDANAEAAETKRRLKALEDATKTEEQKRAERLQELEGKSTTFETQQQEWRVERAILLHAPEVGLKPALALKLVDLAELKTDKNGEPTNIPELLAKILTDYPELKSAQQQGQPPTPGQPRQNIGASNPPRSATSGQGQLTMEYIAKLSTTPEGHAEYIARRAEIQAFIAKNQRRY